MIENGMALGVVLVALVGMVLLGIFMVRQRPRVQQQRPDDHDHTLYEGLRAVIKPRTGVEAGAVSFVPSPLPATELPRGVRARVAIMQSPDMSLPGGGAFEIKTREFTIGRGVSNDLIVNAEGVSKVHATIKWLNRQFVITDQRSTNHTMVDGERLSPLEPKPLEPDKDYVVTLGHKTRLQFSYHRGSPTLDAKTEVEAGNVVPSPLGEKTASVADEELPPNVQVEVELVNQAGDSLGKRTITTSDVMIGRKKTNTLAFDNAEISRLHAHLVWREHRYFLEDLDSGNGTFLDGYRLTRFDPVELAQGKIYQIRLGRESEAIRFRFRYVVTAPPQLPDEEDEPTLIPEE